MLSGKYRLRQEEEPSAELSHDLGGLGAFVCREIVENDDVTRAKGRRQLGGDVGVESGSVHSPRDHPGRGEAVTAQPGYEGLRAPSVRTAPWP